MTQPTGTFYLRFKILEHIDIDGQVHVFLDGPGGVLLELELDPFDFIQKSVFVEDAPPPPPPESAEERKARLIAEARARVQGGTPALTPEAIPLRISNQPAPPPEALSLRAVLPRPGPQPPGQRPDPVVEKLRREAQTADADLAALGIRLPKDDPMKDIIRINAEAGPDGSDISVETARKIAAIVDGPDPANVRRSAYQLLVGLPYQRLMIIRPALSRELAWQIGSERASANRDANETQNYIPAEWAAFIAGDSTQEVYGELLTSARTTVMTPGAPIEPEGLDKVPESMFEKGGSSLSTLESRAKSMQASGNVTLK